MPIETSRVEELFHAAEQIDDLAERQAWLTDACAGDAELQRRVESLLRAATDANSFLNLPAIEIAGELQREGTLAFDGDGTSRTSDHEGSLSRQDVLTFLQPTSRSDSLGRLGHYEVFEVIGQGGFGTVLRAFDDKLHRVVALKVLAPELAANGSARKRFIREARTAAAVKNEHVVAIYEVDENAQPPYLAMEMIDGKSLQQKIDQEGPLCLKEILRIGMQMAEGLAAAHKQGLVHRDVKPANILLENGVERVKLTDFGLARAVDDASVTQSGTVAGTPLYMSPEQAEGLAVDHRSDLFSLGTVLYAMCTGHSAFRASSTHAVLKRVIEASPRPISETNPDVPQWLEAIIAKLHAKNPADRFGSAHEVAELLSQHLAHEQNPERAQRPATITLAGARTVEQRSDAVTTARGNNRIVIVVLAICALLVLVPLTLAAIGIGSYFMHHSQSAPAAPQLVGVLSLELNNTAIEFRIDGDGPNQTAVSSLQLPLPPGEHWLWLKLDDVELKTDKFTIQPGQERELKVSINPADAFAAFDGAPLGMQQLAGRGIAIRVGNGSIVLPGDAKSAFQNALRSPNEETYTPLFNGRNLTGWAREPDKHGWQAEYGVLIGQGMAGFLVSDKEYGDFHLRARVKISRDGDSGIYFRCRPDRTLPRGVESGYEAQIIGPGTTAHRAGSLYRFNAGQTEDVLLVEKNLIEADRWFDYEIIAQQATITIKVNGETITEYKDPQPFATGKLALDLYEDRGRVEFEKLEIRELFAAAQATPPTPAAVTATEPTPESVALRELVAAAEQARDAARARYEAGQVNRLAVIAAEVEVVEARLRLAGLDQKQSEIVSLLKELVALWTEAKKLKQTLIENGIEPVDAINSVDLKLADAKARLAKAEGVSP